MKREPLQELLNSEFGSRRERSPKYSLRSFARFLGIDHSSLGQMLRGDRPVPTAMAQRIGKKLGLSAEEIRAYIAASHVPEDAVLARQQHLKHWSAEAVAVIRDRTHYQICQLSRRDDFRADVRWIAAQAGTPPDEVNVCLQRLLRLGLLRMQGERWLPLEFESESQFRNLALRRVSTLAAQHLPPFSE